MRNYIYIFILTSAVCFGQSREYNKRFKSDAFRFLTETENTLHVKDIITKSAKFGYKLKRNGEGEISHESPIGNYIILIKELNDSGGEYLFPYYSSGLIQKKIFFSPYNIEEAIQHCVITEIVLFDITGLSTSRSRIKRFYTSTIDYITEHIDINNNIESTEVVFENPLYYLRYGNTYPFINEVKYNSIVDDFALKETFSYGETSGDNESNTVHAYSLGFQHHNELWDRLVEYVDAAKSFASDKKSTLKDLRDNIGDRNLEEINTYDLTEMVRFFLDDCKRTNIIVPNIETVSARFEPLEDGVLALAYGMNDDKHIIIRVDPKSWQNASLQKKWYVLYHELGHDVLNLNHGEGGKMMFNFADRDYSWDEFYNDKDYMFDFVLEN